METVLQKFLNELTIVQVYLRKLGPEKRHAKPEKVLSEINKAKSIYDEFLNYINDFSDKELNVDVIYNCINSIKLCYEKILSYGISTTIQTEHNQNMEDFNIKAATSLIPILDGSEQCLESLIGAIELYKSCIKTDQHPMLIKFILKTRLDKTSKLKLKDNYDTVDSLLHDITQFLLTRKSPHSLQQQLACITQNNLSITKYGEKLEQLFSELTISQAEGNAEAIKVLSPINERFAINKFADGLRSRRLSTIIAARNYASLREAVRGAEDEQLATSSSMQQRDTVMSAHSQYPRGRGAYQRYQTSPRFQGHSSRGLHYQRPPTRKVPAFQGRNFYNTNSTNYYRQPPQNKYNRTPRGRIHCNNRGRNNYKNNSYVVNSESPTEPFFRAS